MKVIKLKTADQLPKELAKKLTDWRERGRVVVLATGVFDILHSEHEIFLKKAKAAGDVLLIGLESDMRVRAIKGEGRPVNSEIVRVTNLERLALADAVFVLPDDFSKPEHHRHLISLIKPSILAVSSHTKHLDKKQAIMEEYAGKVEIVHQHNPAISTSKIIEREQRKNGKK